MVKFQLIINILNIDLFNQEYFLNSIYNFNNLHKLINLIEIIIIIKRY